MQALHPRRLRTHRKCKHQTRVASVRRKLRGPFLSDDVLFNGWLAIPAMQTRHHCTVELVLTYTCFRLRWANGTVRCQCVNSGPSTARLPALHCNPSYWTSVSIEQQQLEAAIIGLEAQRSLLGDVLVDTAVGPLRAKLAALKVAAPVPIDAREQRLKQVTVLFTDIVGSTSMSQQLDPEEIHTIMDSALQQFTVLVKKHNGRVLKYMGDGLLAAFGVDDVRENDAEQGVRAGVSMLVAAKVHAVMVDKTHGIQGFDIRVGIHTGDVLYGGGVDSETSIRGMTVNIAARMEQTAPPGSLRISHDTYAHVRGVFDVEAQSPIQVKGVDDPITSYMVLRTKARSFRTATRGIEGVETRLIGRDAEMEVLQEAVKRVHTQGKFAAVTMVGDAGMGKSRMLYELRNWIELRPEPIKVFQGRANPQTINQPYGLLRDVLAWRLLIADSDSVEVAKQKIEEGIAPLFAPDHSADMAMAHAHLLGHLIGLDFGDSPHVKGIKEDGKQIRNRGFYAATEMFRRVAEQGVPVILYLDDLHWADNGTLDFLSYLAQINRAVPILMVCLARPTLFERKPDWCSPEGSHRRVDICPLDKSASRLLVNELLKKLLEIPAALRELITGGSDGNPFYMEELIKMLVGQGAIDTSQDRWAVNSAKLLSAKVPGSLTGILQARLDSLPANERFALQRSSVIGLTFWDEALAAVDPHAVDALAALVQRELVTPRRDGSLDDVCEYAFNNQLLHRVAYDTLLKSTRREVHAQAAAWLSSLTGARANDFLGATAEHYEKAGNAKDAAEFFKRAAEHALHRSALDVSLDYASRGLALIAPTAEIDAVDTLDTAAMRLRFRLLEIRYGVWGLQGKRAEQRSALDTMQNLADALDDDVHRGKVAGSRSLLAISIGDVQAQEFFARQAMTLAHRSQDWPMFLSAQRVVADALVKLGRLEDGKAMALDGLAQAREQSQLETEGKFQNVLTLWAEAVGDPISGLEACREELLMMKNLGNQVGQARALINLGDVLLVLGDNQQGRMELERGLRKSRATGGRRAECSALNNLSLAAIRLGDDTQALALARLALDIGVEIQGPAEVANAQVRIGNAELALGRNSDARVAFGEAYEITRKLGRARQHDAADGLARVALLCNEMPEALQAIEGLLARLDTPGGLNGVEAPRLARLTCYRVLARNADPRAADVLARAYEELQASAAKISDARMRHNFLTNIPEHREITTTWAAKQIPTEF